MLVKPLNAINNSSNDSVMSGLSEHCIWRLPQERHPLLSTRCDIKKKPVRCFLRRVKTDIIRHPIAGIEIQFELGISGSGDGVFGV